MVYHGKLIIKRKFGNETYDSGDRFLFDTRQEAYKVANQEAYMLADGNGNLAKAIVRKQGNKYRVWLSLKLPSKSPGKYYYPDRPKEKCLCGLDAYNGRCQGCGKAVEECDCNIEG